MSRLTLFRKTSLRIARPVVVVTLLLFVGTTTVVQGIGLNFWDDSGSPCDVQNAIGTASKCNDPDFNVALVSTMTTAVPKGTTTVRIVYNRIPIHRDASNNPVLDANGDPWPLGSDPIFVSKTLHYDIVGSAWCPTYAGTPGINQKDRSIAGYFDNGGVPDNSKISTGTRVTDFQVNQVDHTNAATYPTRLIAGTGDYRASSAYCDVAGGSFTVRADVLPNDLHHQEGFPPTTFYVELKVSPNLSLKRLSGADFADASGNSICVVPNIDNTHCEGISNKFRVALTGTPPGTVTYNTVSGSSIQSSDDYNVTYTNSKYEADSAYTTNNSHHYSAVYRFGADCTVVQNPGGWVHALLYDIDDSATPYNFGNNTGDQQKALLVRTDASGNVYTLKKAAYTGPSKSKQTNLTDPSVPNNPWNPRSNAWTPDYSDTDARVVDDQTSNKYYSLNFTAYVGDTYKLYVYDTRFDVVNQIGAPFDSVYYNNTCNAEVDPGVALNPPSGTYSLGAPVTADASITNPGNLDVRAPWNRYFYYSPGNSDYAGAAAGQALIQSQASAGNGKNVPANSTVSSTDAPPSFGGTWSTNVAPPVGSNFICTEMQLDTKNLIPAGATTKPPNGIARKCRAIAGAAPGGTPYFSVVGGDIAAGPGFGACNTGGKTADITANFNTGASYGGASSQLAALALTDINGFATGKYDDGSAPNPWRDAIIGNTIIPLLSLHDESDLAFGNTLKPSGDFGGFYNNSSWCVNDYYDNADKNNNGPDPGPTLNMSTASGVYKRNGDLTLNGGVVGDDQHVTVIVTGDVYINGPGIRFAAPSALGKIPSFQLYVTGRILVSPTAGELDGFYDAQGPNGQFITCADSSGGIADFTSCNIPLTVKGAVAATQVVPNRTYGDIDGQAAFGQQNPAETFLFSPQVWLQGITGGGNVGPWDSVTSLPPIL